MSLLKKIKREWWFKLLFKPDLYLKGLLISSIGVGLITGIMYVIFKYNGGDTGHETIPPAFHSILAVVLGLLLVFRTNTAYERWWKGREYLSKMETNYLFIRSKLELLATDAGGKKTNAINAMRLSLSTVEQFLVRDNSMEVKQAFVKHIDDLLAYDKRFELGVDGYIHEILDAFTSLERIRDTPIPLSYSLHIKFSIFLYFLTLPFGVLYATGYWSILFVMILYYVIAGIEIISNEIENPFHGDPNDLPVKKFIDNIKEQIK